MTITISDKKVLVEILKDQVKPALGCTEPSAVGLAVARAKEILGEEVCHLNITVDKNMLKNGLNVGIPGTNERGLIFAAALALVVGKSKYGLEVFKDVTDQDVKKALDIVVNKIINIKLDSNIDGLYVCVDAHGKEHNSQVIIEKSHTNIVHEAKDYVVIKDEGYEDCASNKLDEGKFIKYEIKRFSLDELIEFASSVPLEELPFIFEGININKRIARYGVEQDIGIGLGRYLMKKVDEPESLAKALTAAASEARMAGCPLPVMSSAGSGNHGLIAFLPISIIGAESKIIEEHIIRSVALSHLITILVKVYLGALSPVCGCGVAAGIGCAAGLVYLKNGSNTQIKGAINNMAAGITGMICDGAKIGCASKLAISAEAAIDAANMAMANIFIPADNGILGETAEQTIINLAHISNVGMKRTDQIILDVMLNGC